MNVPRIRIRRLLDAPVATSGSYVLYWMSAARRARFNYALDRALKLCEATNKPLLVLEALRLDYPWASERLHRFVLDGMRDNARDFEASGVSYFPYVEPVVGHARGLFLTLARDASAVVTDDFPCFFLPRALRSATEALRPFARLFEAVDGNGLLPMHSTDVVFSRAFSFREHLKKSLASHLTALPRSNALAGYAFGHAQTALAVRERWPAQDLAQHDIERLLPFERDIKPAPFPGGARAANLRLTGFLRALGNYEKDRNHPDLAGGSGLSPYLHFGHLSAHQVFDAVQHAAPAEPSLFPDEENTAQPELESARQAFLDQLITWRELGFNFCSHRADYDQLASLPRWAQQTLAEHRGDAREFRYTPKQFERAATHDEVWNAAQRQLLREGRMHNYMRMLWGKKILEWSDSPESALATMIDLNNAYAVDGRDPNSYSGIMWVLGRYDRAFGPERPVLGKLRFMTTASARRKLRLREYLRRYGGEAHD